MARRLITTNARVWRGAVLGDRPAVSGAGLLARPGDVFLLPGGAYRVDLDGEGNPAWVQDATAEPTPVNEATFGGANLSRTIVVNATIAGSQREAFVEVFISHVDGVAFSVGSVVNGRALASDSTSVRVLKAHDGALSLTITADGPATPTVAVIVDGRVVVAGSPLAFTAPS